MSAQAIPEPPIESESIQANGQTFEVFTCGSGDKLALCLHGFPEHALSDSAAFRVGESYYNAGAFNSAFESWDRMVKR